MKKVAIIGASGYVGGELLRLLLFHKGVEIVAATSRANAGKKISEVHQNLNKLTDVEFTDESAEAVAGKADLVFFALPHCISMDTIPKVIGKTKIIDMSADYRLKDAEVFERYYKKKHCSSDLFNEFVYGLPEINRGKIKNAKNVANPGCFPAGAILALYPLAKQGLLEGNIVMDSKTGSSGSGAEPSFGTHHPERAEDFKAYKVFSHQHQPEMEQELESANGKKFNYTFVAHSASMVRGIFSTAYLFPKKEISQKKLEEIYMNQYGKEHFIRIVDQPRCTVVKGTNFCDIGLKSSGNKIVVMSATDNMMKGAAGTAIQNMNLMLGFDEKQGLMFSGFHP